MSERFKASGLALPRGHWLRLFLAVLMLAVSGPLAAAHAATTDANVMQDSLTPVSASHADDGSADRQNPDVPAGQHHLHCAVCHCPLSTSARVQDSAIVPAVYRISYRLFDTSDAAKHHPSPLPEPPRG